MPSTALEAIPAAQLWILKSPQLPLSNRSRLRRDQVTEAVRRNIAADTILIGGEGGVREWPNQRFEISDFKRGMGGSGKAEC